MKIFSQGNEKHEEGLKVLVAQSHLTHHDPMDGSLPGSSVHGIFQARIHPGRGLLWGRWILYWLIHHTCMHAQLLKLCLTLCDPVNCSPPGSLSMGFPRQEYWNGLPCFPTGALPNPGVKPVSLMTLHKAGSLLLAPTGKALSHPDA